MPIVLVLITVAESPSMVNSTSGWVTELGAEGKISLTYLSRMAAIPFQTRSSDGLSGV